MRIEKTFGFTSSKGVSSIVITSDGHICLDDWRDVHRWVSHTVAVENLKILKKEKKDAT